MRCFIISAQKAVAIAKKEGFTLPKEDMWQDRLLATGAKLYKHKGKYVISSYAYDDRDAVPYLTASICPLMRYLKNHNI